MNHVYQLNLVEHQTLLQYKMALIIDTLKPFFVPKEVNDDNFVCKLYHRATFAFLILGCVLVGANQFIGDPIKCDEPIGHKIDDDLLSSYCWIHGSYHLPKKFTEKAALTSYCVRKPEEVRNSIIHFEVLSVVTFSIVEAKYF